MKLLIKQRFFSWLDSYDIYDETGKSVYKVKGELAFGHRLKIYDNNQKCVGMIKEKIFVWLPRFQIFLNNNYLGEVKKEFTFFNPKFKIDYNGWQITGDLFGWNYEIIDNTGNKLAIITKKLWNFPDTYAIEILNPKDTLEVLLMVLALDAQKCSSNNN